MGWDIKKRKNSYSEEVMSALFVWPVIQRFIDFFLGVKKNRLDNKLFIS